MQPTMTRSRRSAARWPNLIPVQEPTPRSKNVSGIGGGPATRHTRAHTLDAYASLTAVTRSGHWPPPRTRIPYALG